MQVRRKIAVAGATGRVGHHVVDVLTAEGHDVVAISRSGRVDVVTGDGLSYVPKMRTQLVAARTVAEALADLATDRQSTPAPGSSEAPILEIAGPREESLVEVAMLLAARRGDPVGDRGRE